MLWLAIVLHETPSAERDAVKVEPVRCRRSQTGAAPLSVVLADVPLVEVRRWNVTPFPAETRAAALRDPTASDSRIMTPPLDHASVYCTLPTRATMVPSPVSVRCTNMNWSAVPQMSIPPPETVKVLLL